jgi:hypothetical protein
MLNTCYIDSATSSADIDIEINSIPDATLMLLLMPIPLL